MVLLCLVLSVLALLMGETDYAVIALLIAAIASSNDKRRY